MKGLVLALSMLVSALGQGKALAETVRVRSGEHSDFSRLVLTLPDAPEWRFTPVEGGYRLAVQAPDLSFDLSGVFGLIPRLRISDIGVDPQTGDLLIQVAEGSRATLVESRPGLLVIDVTAQENAAGPARPGPGAALALPARPRRGAEPWFTNPDLSEAKTRLIEQMGRAASQGLVELELPPPFAKLPRDGFSAPSALSPRAWHALKAHTVFDGDGDGAFADADAFCPPDAVLDIAAWGDDRPVAVQLAERRRALVAEFDRPDVQAVAGLARFYLYLGFGAEARAVLAGFDITPPDAAALHALADIMEGSPGGAQALAGFLACEGPAALWASLSPHQPVLPQGLNTGAVLRAFSALPVHLRRHLGPALIERLMAGGYGDAARAVRDAILRAEGDAGASVRLLAARLDLAAGQERQAQAQLQAIVAEGGPAGAEALLDLVALGLARGEPIDSATVEALAAFAHEYRTTGLGHHFARTHVLALASGGAWPLAFTAFDRLAPEDRAQAAEPLLAMLVARADDLTFLRHMFSDGARLDPAPLPRALRLEIAERLLALGFPAEARDKVGLPAELTGEERDLLIRAALALRDPRMALRLFAGAGDARAIAYRARAQELLGGYAAAAAAWAEIGMEAAQAAAAWRAGDWQMIGRIGTQAQKALLDQGAPGFAPAPADPAPPPQGDEAPAPAGALTRARGLLEGSKALRAAADDLLAAHPAGE